MIKINEIFYSIQGEGQWMGFPNIFIRTTGCNLRCSYCDTKFAYEDGEEMSISNIFKLISQFRCKQVCITGGEPLLQNQISELIEELTKQEYKVIIETNGSISIKPFINKKNVYISMDIKCPSSNMHEKNDLKNISLLDTSDQMKCIIENIKDYEYAKKIIKEYSPICKVYFQPMWGFNPKILAEWILKDHLSVHLGVQLHKIIWGEKRGV